MKIGFMGSGAIAEIIGQSAVRSGTVKADDVCVYDIWNERLSYMHDKYGFTACDMPGKMISKSDFVFMCVRSDDAIEMAKTLGAYDFSGKVIVSISSGIPMALYEKNVSNAAVARALPNPPSRIGHGVIALAFNAKVCGEKKEELKKLFSAMGTCLVLDEDKINAVTSLTGPAPIYAFFQGIVESAVLLGINHSLAAEMAYGTLRGCLKVWENDINNISGLLEETSTPGGISVRQLYNLEQNSFKATVKECYEEGYLRTKAYSDTIKEMLKD